MAAGCLELHCAPCKMPRPACRGAPAATGRVVDSPRRLGSPRRAHGTPWWKCLGCTNAAPQAFPGRVRQGWWVWWCFWWAWAEHFWKIDSLSHLRPQGLSGSTGTNMVEEKMGLRHHRSSAVPEGYREGTASLSVEMLPEDFYLHCCLKREYRTMLMLILWSRRGKNLPTDLSVLPTNTEITAQAALIPERLTLGYIFALAGLAEVHRAGDAAQVTEGTKPTCGRWSYRWEEPRGKFHFYEPLQSTMCGGLSPRITFWVCLVFCFVLFFFKKLSAREVTFSEGEKLEI